MFQKVYKTFLTPYHRSMPATDPDSAFVESAAATESRRTPKSIKLSLNENGSIDWENTSQKHTQAFIEAIKVDPNGILDNIREEAGSAPSPDEEPTGIADATVIAAANAVMVIEAVGVTAIGPRFVPVLKNLHPIVAIKACSVTVEELKPVIPACKRIIKRHVPLEYLGQEYQDIAIVAEHLLKLSAAKFKACVDLAIEIEQMKSAGQPNKPNGRVTIIEAEPTKQ
jgi:hypothetical protein